jgi:hypothetical protein
MTIFLPKMGGEPQELAQCQSFGGVGEMGERVKSGEQASMGERVKCERGNHN